MSESCYRNQPWLVVVGVVVSVASSLWTLAIDDVINNDGVHYILTAERIAAGEWLQALQTFKWPAYSFLIYVVQLLPGIDYLLAAHVVTTIGFTIAVLAFVAVVHALGGRDRVLWLALATVLVYPGINEFRSFLIRDSVFLAFYLLGLWQLVHHAATGRLLPLLWSGLLFFLAALFRVEAVVFVFLLPVIAIHRTVRRPWRYWILAIYVLLTARTLALFYGWWLYRPEGPLDPWTLLDQPEGMLSRTLEQVGATFNERVAVLRYDVLDGASAGFAWVATLLTVAMIVVRESVEAITIPFSILLVVAVASRRFEMPWSYEVRRMFFYVLALHLAMLFAFAFARFFLTPRYPVAFALTLSLVVPFVVSYLVSHTLPYRPRWRRRLVTASVVFLLLVNAVEGLDNFTNKRHVKHAGDWFRASVGPTARVISNDPKFVFYADRYREHWVLLSDEDEFSYFLRSGMWQWKDYVVVRVNHDERALEALLARTLAQRPLKTFEGENGDRILVFFTADE